MKRLLALALVAFAGCAILPEEGPEMQKLAGRLVFPQTTALPPGSVARVKVIPAGIGDLQKPVAEVEVPAKTGNFIPFSKKIPAEKVKTGEFLVIAQVMDHGIVRWSNLTTPTRVSFVAEPTDLLIPLRPE